MVVLWQPIAAPSRPSPGRGGLGMTRTGAAPYLRTPGTTGTDGRLTSRCGNRRTDPDPPPPGGTTRRPNMSIAKMIEDGENVPAAQPAPWASRYIALDLNAEPEDDGPRGWCV